MTDKTKALVPNDYSPGSQPLRNRVQERYARYRAQALPRIQSLKEAARTAFKGPTKTYSVGTIHTQAWRLENNPLVNQRIQYLTKDAVALVSDKRKRLEESLWAMHEANIKDFFEGYDEVTNIKDGNNNSEIIVETTPKERPRRLVDLPDEIAALVEDVTIDSKGRVIPKLYSKLAASKELRAMLNIGKPTEASEVSRLSDAELVAQLSDQAKQLGVEINLSYDFAKPGEPSGDVD